DLGDRRRSARGRPRDRSPARGRRPRAPARPRCHDWIALHERRQRARHQAVSRPRFRRAPHRPLLRARGRAGVSAPTDPPTPARPPRDDARALRADRGEPKYRADQVFDGLWTQRRPLAEITNIGRALRDDLAAALPEALTLAVEQTGDRGQTTKWLWRARAGAQIETVLMRYRDRA